MDNVLYVTKIIINSTGEDIYIMIDKTTYRKYLSKEKDKYVPYDDPKLLEKLNDNRISNSESLQKIKRRAVKAVAIATCCSIVFL